MDIEILLLLQKLREITGGIFNDFFAFITTIAVDYYVIIPALIIMWAIDKKKGIFAYASYGIACFINAILKSTFCVYRPWIRSSKIEPLASAMSGATGYSFPSGHATGSSSVYLGIRNKYKKYKAINIFCVAIVIVIMFSRMFVGVHTPQDVVVGLLIGIGSVVIINSVFKYINSNPNKDWLVLLITIIITVIGLIYVGIKPYPVDYVDGKVLVDPAKMTINSFKDPGTFFGFVVGWFLERRFVNFDTDGEPMEKVMRCLVGGLLYIFTQNSIIIPLAKSINVGLGYFLLFALNNVIFMTVYPALAVKFEAWTRARRAAKAAKENKKL